jgi:hypothetical protein
MPSLRSMVEYRGRVVTPLLVPFPLRFGGIEFRFRVRSEHDSPALVALFRLNYVRLRRTATPPRLRAMAGHAAAPRRSHGRRSTGVGRTDD